MNKFLGTLSSSKVSLAQTKIGNREAYTFVGFDAKAGFDPNARDWKKDGSTPHDVGTSRSHVGARKEIEALWTEIADMVPGSRISPMS